MPRPIRDDDAVRQPILQSSDNDQQHDDDVNDLDFGAEEPTGCGSSALCNPSSSLHRFMALIFMCLLGFGSYFCYDNPGALQDNFKADLDLTTTQFVMLYSIYSWPNVILCFIGGFLIDRVFGIRLGTIIYMFILMIGQLIFAMGGVINAFWLMVLGRFIFGIGAESLAVAQNNYAVLWFKGKELNMVFGLQLSFARVGSTVNFLVMEPVYKYVNQFYKGYQCTGVVLLLASTTCVMSMVCALILGWMDKRAQRILRRNDNPDGEIAKLSDVKTFKISFWMVTVICVAYYVAIFPFIALGKVFFERKFDYSPEDANTVNSIVYIISAVASPLLGLLVDKTGRNVMWVFVSIIVTIFAHGLLAFTFLNPYIGMVVMGISYSMLASSLWPLVALIVPEYQLGTAYGICQSVQNLGLAVVSMVTGIIVDRGGFFMLELFFMAWLFIALIATIVIWLYNANVGGTLNMTPVEREAHVNSIDPRVYERFSSPMSSHGNNPTNYQSTSIADREKFAASQSVENIDPADVNAYDGETSRRRRILHNEGGAANPAGDSDCEPLLK